MHKVHMKSQCSMNKGDLNMKESELSNLSSINNNLIEPDMTSNMYDLSTAEWLRLGLVP